MSERVIRDAGGTGLEGRSGVEENSVLKDVLKRRNDARRCSGLALDQLWASQGPAREDVAAEALLPVLAQEALDVLEPTTKPRAGFLEALLSGLKAR